VSLKVRSMLRKKEIRSGRSLICRKYTEAGQGEAEQDSVAT
jgi:hypothetical protein